MIIRPDFEKLVPGLWTVDEAFHHLQGTFNHAVKEWPDVMESYVVMLADATDQTERTRIMRNALRETVKARYGDAV